MALRVTLPHRYDFGESAELVGDDLLRPEAWDSLRTQTSGPFSMAADRGELERQADEHPEVGERMRRVDTALSDRGCRHLVSYGVGGALPEMWLLRLDPERQLTITDYAPETVGRLKNLLPEADVRRHDLQRDPPLAADAHLFHRIDTELDNAQWRRVYERFAGQTIVVVATGVLPVKEIPGHLVHLINSRHATNAGLTRTRGAFEALWSKTHRGTEMSFGDLGGWVLEPR
jgi:hypothetical protein